MEALTSSIEYKQELNRGKDNKKCWNFQNIFEIPRIIVSLQRLDKSRGIKARLGGPGGRFFGSTLVSRIDLALLSLSSPAFFTNRNLPPKKQNIRKGRCAFVETLSTKK